MSQGTDHGSERADDSRAKLDPENVGGGVSIGSRVYASASSAAARARTDFTFAGLAAARRKIGGDLCELIKRGLQILDDLRGDDLRRRQIL